MKQLELNLKERLIIVELPEDYTFNTYADKLTICNEINKPVVLIDGKWELICKGSELTEEVAKELVDSLPDAYNVDWFKDYTVIDTQLHDNYTFLNALESFISSIEAQGYYWGENPYKDPYTQIEIYGNNSPETTTNYHNDLEKFQKAESRTFNPEKSIIFKILKS